MRLREELKVIASGALGGAIGTSLVLLMSLHIPAPDRSGDWATWVQAIGGIAALLVGVAAFTWPEHQRRGEERQNAVYVTLDVLQLLRRLPEELTSPNPYRPYGMQLEWLLDVIEVNIRWVDRVPFQYLRLGAEDDDVYFTSVYLHRAKKELEELIQLQVPREYSERIKLICEGSNDSIIAMDKRLGISEEPWEFPWAQRVLFYR